MENNCEIEFRNIMIGAVCPFCQRKYAVRLSVDFLSKHIGEQIQTICLECGQKQIVVRGAGSLPLPSRLVAMEREIKMEFYNEKLLTKGLPEIVAEFTPPDIYADLKVIVFPRKERKGLKGMAHDNDFYHEHNIKLWLLQHLAKRNTVCLQVSLMAHIVSSYGVPNYS